MDYGDKIILIYLYGYLYKFQLDNQKALKILYELRTELQKSDETAKLKQLNQIISVLESSFFRKIVGIHKSLEALKKQKVIKIITIINKIN